MKIKLMSRDRYLWQKIRLLRPEDEVVSCEGEVGEYDKLIWDTECMGGGAPSGTVVLVREGDTVLGAGENFSTLSYGFDEAELSAALGLNGKERLTLDGSARTATLDGRLIRLTEVEFSLLYELYRKIGEFIPRGELIKRVWGDIGNDSLINVYVHYLREKLEVGSQRFIFSSRKEGYKLDVGGAAREVI